MLEADRYQARMVLVSIVSAAAHLNRKPAGVAVYSAITWIIAIGEVKHEKRV